MGVDHTVVELRGTEIGLVPGTGRMGMALAAHLCRAGVRVLLGSRDPIRAAQAAATVLARCNNNPVTMAAESVVGLSNEEAAARAGVVVWSPRGSLEEREGMLRKLAAQLEGKIIVDVSNIGYAVEEREWGQTSSTLRNQAALGVPARWTTAFKATFARVLEAAKHGGKLEGTIVCGDDLEAVDVTVALVEKVPGFFAIRGGGLRNTKIVEMLGPPWLIELDELNGGASHLSGWQFGV